MPEPAHRAVIAADLPDATAATATLGGTWCRLLVGRDRPADVADLDCPSVTVTQAALIQDAAAVHNLVAALREANPHLEVLVPHPPFTGPTQEQIDQVRAELEADTDQVLAGPIADWELELLDAPPVGSFGLARIGGTVGALVAAGQAVLWDGSRYTHAFVVVDGGQVVQAMPRGAELAPLTDYLGRDDVVFTDAPVQLALDAFRDWVWEPDVDPADLVTDVTARRYELNLRTAIAAKARALIGTPYSFADYLALAAVRLGLPSRALRRYVADSGRMICSQLVDAVYCRTGIHLFDDGRPSMDVTPGDLDAWRVRQLEQRAAELEQRWTGR